jgi:hypothetical protein
VLLTLSNPSSLLWSFPTRNRIIGKDRNETIFEWYGESGGQLKYYPLAQSATWASSRFQLEPLSLKEETGIIAKAATYFPLLWKAASEGGEG